MRTADVCRRQGISSGKSRWSRTLLRMVTVREARRRFSVWQLSHLRTAGSGASLQPTNAPEWRELVECSRLKIWQEPPTKPVQRWADPLLETCRWFSTASRSTFGGWLRKVSSMGSVHKFQRPPKNEQQFKGYRPPPSSGQRGGKSARWQLRNWQKSLIAWSALVLLAVAIWGIGRLP